MAFRNTRVNKGPYLPKDLWTMDDDDASSDEETQDKTQSRSRTTESEDEVDYHNMEPEKVFGMFDTDGSGFISLDEFQSMLPKLGIKISGAKAAKYFKMCDTDGSGEIDVEEFKVALFACDPTTGNSTGFQPSSLLTPLDAFEMFDEDKSGEIDEDEFAFVLEYLALDISDEKQEKLFSRYDKDGTGSISYEEFKQIWISVADVKKELSDRGIDLPKFATKRQLQRMLAKVIDDEEDAEKFAMAEAEQWREWRGILEQKNIFLKKARLRAQRELSKALDSAGQVYVFGTGAANQFHAPARGLLLEEEDFDDDDEDSSDDDDDDDSETTTSSSSSSRRRKTKPHRRIARNKFQLQGQDLLRRLWTRRVTAGKADLEVKTEKKNTLDDPDAIDVDDLRTELENSAFADLPVAENTAMLWGSRISHVGLTDNVILAVSDLGDLWTWGGNDRWWYKIEPDSKWHNKWPGATTPRSQLLLGTCIEDDDEHEKPETTVEPPKKKKTTKTEPAEERLRLVLAYYDMWKPAPTDLDREKYYGDVLLPTVNYQDMALSLEVRGKTGGQRGTKRQMADALYRDMKLEKRVLGERAHRKIRELEMEMKELVKRRRGALAKRLKMDIQKMWSPLLEIQAEEDAKERARLQTKIVEDLARRERRYHQWRKDVAKARTNIHRPEYTPRGNSLIVETSGATARGPPRTLPQGYQAATAVAGGAHHFAMIHQSGSLYTWGVGHAGRLGLDLTEHGDPRADAKRPTLVQALQGTPVVQVSCGHAHTACITAANDLYVWGSAASGKLGLGNNVLDDDDDELTTKKKKFDDDSGCYSSLPIAVPLKVMGRRYAVKHVSCGAAHTGATTLDGRLFLWGCGDGGRLGFGDMTTRYEPEFHSKFDGILIEKVACGNAHTLITTAVVQVDDANETGVKTLEGGRVYVAGSAATLGERFGSSEFINVSDTTVLDGVVATDISAGFAHSGVVTSEGELYLWGQNDAGCCGQPVGGKKKRCRFVSEPTLARAIYAEPANIALGKPAKQSSIYGGLDAHLAVDGNCDGSSGKYCASTQQDAQAWWQVDLLSDDAVVTAVKIWNRCDEPSDMSMQRDKYTSRLVPSWIMCAQKPFDDEIGGESLVRALSNSVAKMYIKKNQRCTHWRVPENTTARYVRFQLENFDFLHVAQIQVFGYPNGRQQHGVGRCGSVTCGRKCTVAVVPPSPDPRAVELAYKRAVRADAYNADILRQFETYALEYDKFPHKILML